MKALPESWILFVLILWPMAAGILCALCHTRWSGKRLGLLPLLAVLAELAVAALALVTYLQRGVLSAMVPGLMGWGLTVALDGFRLLCLAVAVLSWAATTAFSLAYFTTPRRLGRYWLCNLFTFGGAVGVFLSADLFTTYIFFEIMSFASYALVAHEEGSRARKAARTYLGMAVFGGIALLFGLLLVYTATGTLWIAALPEAAAAHPSVVAVGAACMLVGFGAKAGIFPLHFWLPQAHPVAPAPASALLSGVLTKTGIFGILIVCRYLPAGTPTRDHILLSLGLAGMLLGGLLAVFSVELKRTLACSSVSQLGMVLLGIAVLDLSGGHGGLAAWGVALHMVNHSAVKLVLFLAAGAVALSHHQLDYDHIRGFGRGKPLFLFAFLMGALSLGGVPLWGGYLSKTLLHESLVEHIHTLELAGLPTAAFRGVEGLFLLSGGLTVAYLCRLFGVLFLGRPAGEPPRPPWLSLPARLLLGGCALPPLVLGLFPRRIGEALAGMGEGFLLSAPPEHLPDYLSWECLGGVAISWGIGLLLALLLRRPLRERTVEGTPIYRDRWPFWLSVECLVLGPLSRLAGRLLRPAGPPGIPRRLARGYGWLLHPEKCPKRREALLFDRLSFALMLFGVGLAAMLIAALVSFVL